MQEISDMIQLFETEIKAIAQRLCTDANVSLSDAESELRCWSRDCERRLLQGCYASRASAEDEGNCPECGTPLERQELRTRWVHTLAGDIQVSRWYCTCPACGHRSFPWDDAQGLRSGYSPSTAEAMCRLSAQLDFRDAREELAHHGIEVSVSSLQQRVEGWAEGVDLVDALEPQALDSGQRWYVTADGCHVPYRDGWHEVKVGSVYRDWPRLAETSAIHALEGSQRYVALRTDSETFGEHWYGLARASGLYDESCHGATGHGAEVVVLGDGAAWIWNQADLHFPDAVQIVDWYHACEHLWECARLGFGEEAADQRQAWVRQSKQPLYAGDIPALVERIRACVTQAPESQKALEREVRYFESHAQRMQYATFRKKGYHIGSGIVEGSCRHLVQQRCKQSGMRWNHDGADAILKWRCLLKNHAWQSYWNLPPLQTEQNTAQKPAKNAA